VWGSRWSGLILCDGNSVFTTSTGFRDGVEALAKRRLTSLLRPRGIIMQNKAYLPMSFMALFGGPKHLAQIHIRFKLPVADLNLLS